VVGQTKEYRTMVFDEIYRSIIDYNPEVEKSWRPIAGNSEGGTVAPVILMNTLKNEPCKQQPQKKKVQSITREQICSIQDAVSKKVFGQKDVLEKVQEYFECAFAGLGEPEKPRGAFIFVGDTGTGKTLAVKEIAKHFWGTDWKCGLFIINGSEMMEEHETAKLLGSPQGYVGYEDGSPLLKHVLGNPETIILVDEFEKAHPRMQDIFLQILDDGSCYDNKGTRVDFSKTFIVFTSNIGTKEVYHKTPTGFGSEKDTSKVGVYVNSALSKFCRVEFLKRFSGIIVFNELTNENYVDICRAEVSYIAARLKKKKIKMKVDKRVYQELVSLLEEGETARDLKALIREHIEIPSAKVITKSESVSEIVVVLEKGSFAVRGA
jgi:ATP-dependent Clp protease ATP-binding subunit ClpE